MKKYRKILPAILCLALLSGCARQTELSQEQRLLARCEEIAAACEGLGQRTVDEMEEALEEAGFDVMDSSEACPAYLTTADRFRDFWERVQQEAPAEQEVISIDGAGALDYRLFSYQDGTAYVFNMRYPLDGIGGRYWEAHEILDWELTDRGNFYYQVYPADRHYPDYTLIRLEPPDLELWELNEKYVMSGGYIATNLFLTDWTEEDFGTLSFNDAWEDLYFDYYGQAFYPDGYAEAGPHRYQLPAEKFETVMLSYFRVDLETLRELAHYQAEGDYYPWRQVQTNDFGFLAYEMIEPEVTAYRVNGDGTLTLTVELLSTDQKLDCLFAHEVTVRPLEDGGFQFVGNRVTSQTELGLPFCEPRLTWDGGA